MSEFLPSIPELTELFSLRGIITFLVCVYNSVRGTAEAPVSKMTSESFEHVPSSSHDTSADVGSRSEIKSIRSLLLSIIITVLDATCR